MEKIIYESNSFPQKIYVDGTPSNNHCFIRNFNAKMIDWQAVYLNTSYDGRIELDDGSKADIATSSFVLNGVGVLYSLIPGQSLRVGLFSEEEFDDRISDVEAKVLSFTDLLPPMFNKLK